MAKEQDTPDAPDEVEATAPATEAPALDDADREPFVDYNDKPDPTEDPAQYSRSTVVDE